MQHYRCKCGKATAHTSGTPMYDCQGCKECKTTLAQSENGHKELIPHDLEDFKEIHEVDGVQKVVKHYKRCKRCDRYLPVEEENESRK